MMKPLRLSLLISICLCLCAAKQGTTVGHGSIVGHGALTGGASSGCTTPSILATYDADTLSASPVTTTWYDGSANHYDLAPGYSGAPTWAASQTPTGHAAVNTSAGYFLCHTGINGCNTLTGIPVPVSGVVTIYVITNFASLTGGNNSFTSSGYSGGNAFQFYVTNAGLLAANLQNIVILGTATTGALSTGTWYSVAVTFNASTGGTLYVNGTSVGTLATNSGTFSAIDTLFQEGTSGGVVDARTTLLTITSAAYDSTYESCIRSQRI